MILLLKIVELTSDTIHQLEDNLELVLGVIWVGCLWNWCTSMPVCNAIQSMSMLCLEEVAKTPCCGRCSATYGGNL
jgi:hypothetical protein